MLLYVLKLNQNAKMPEAYGKYYAYPVITQTVGIDGLAEHMASHNTPFSKGAIKGMITDMVSCIKELTLQGFAVKIDDLAIFSIGIRNKEGAASEKEFITHHSTLSNHRPERILAHPARFLLGLPQISQIYTDNSLLQATVLYSSGLTAKNSEGVYNL